MAADGTLYTFTTSSRGGLGAIADLSRRYGRHRRKHDDVFPLIALDVDSYQHNNKAYGRIKVPQLTPMGGSRRTSSTKHWLRSVSLSVTLLPPSRRSRTR